MNYKVKLKVEIYAPDEVLKDAHLSYYSMERIITLNFVPFPGLTITTKPTVNESNREKYSELFHTVVHKTGIFQVDRCIVNIDSESEIDITAILKGKTEQTAEKFLALKEFLKYYGFIESYSHNKCEQ